MRRWNLALFHHSIWTTQILIHTEFEVQARYYGTTLDCGTWNWLSLTVFPYSSLPVKYSYKEGDKGRYLGKLRELKNRRTFYSLTIFRRFQRVQQNYKVGSISQASEIFAIVSDAYTLHYAHIFIFMGLKDMKIKLNWWPHYISIRRFPQVLPSQKTFPVCNFLIAAS